VRVDKEQIELWRALPVPAFIVNVDPGTRLVLVRSCQEITALLREVTTQTKTIHFTHAAKLTPALEQQIRAAVSEFWTSMRSGLGGATAALLGLLSAGIVGVMPLPIGIIAAAVVCWRRLSTWPRGVPKDDQAFKHWLKEFVRKRR
jgi:hypothetical protein